MSLAWCVDRLIAFQPLAPGRPALVNTTSDWMNEVFHPTRCRGTGPWANDDTTAQAGNRPTPDLPAQVLTALDSLLEANSRVWTQPVDQVFSVLPIDWRKSPRHGPKPKPNQWKLRS